jgi:hypothetical protein
MTELSAYDPEVELAKGAKLEALCNDETQKIAIVAGLVTVGGKPGLAEISGRASGGDNILCDLWLSIFRYRRPDGSIDHVSGLNVGTKLVPGQGAIDTAKSLAAAINSSRRPYKATASGGSDDATVTIVFVKDK